MCVEEEGDRERGKKSNDAGARKSRTFARDDDDGNR